MPVQKVPDRLGGSPVHPVDRRQILHALSRHGLSIIEAAHESLAAGGADAFDVLRRWWDAGVPRDEVASWLVAGFAPDEALRARADGATAERAAVLRALGGGIGPASAGPDR